LTDGIVLNQLAVKKLLFAAALFVMIGNSFCQLDVSYSDVLI